MSQKNSKLKMVSFRLSSAEYEAASAACRAHGFRSMSMLARSAFLAFSPGQNTQIPYDKELTEIRQRLEFLTDELNRLAIIVGAPQNEHPPAQDQKSYLPAGLGTRMNP